MKLDNLGFVGRGKSKHRPRNDPSLYGGEYPFIQTGDVKEANLWLRRYTQTYNEVGLAQSKLWPPGTLCITIAANIAETAILKIPACFPDSIVGFIPHDGKADARFVKYYIDTIKLRMQNVSKGTTQDNLSVDKLLSFDFDVPDYPIQERIASILCAYDDLIENNTRRIRIQEEMAQMLYREWFVNLRFPWLGKERMAGTNIAQLPDGWTASSVGFLAEDVRRSVNPAELDPETPYIGLEHMPRQSIALSEWGAAKEVQSTKLRFYRGEILFGKIRPYFHKVGFAPVDGVSSSDAIVIVPRKEEWSSLVLCCVSSGDFVRQATQTSQGTKMPRANWDVLTRYPVALPKEEALRQFNNILTPILDLIRTLIFCNRKLRQSRDLLLPRLISGEVSVEHPETEPATQIS